MVNLNKLTCNESLINLHIFSSLFIFPGNPYPITTIQWRTTEDYLVFGYSDDSAYVWQMQTAHLDRVLHGENARDVLEDDRWPLNRISSTTIQKSGGNSSKQTVSIKSIMSNDNGKIVKKGKLRLSVY